LLYPNSSSIDLDITNLLAEILLIKGVSPSSLKTAVTSSLRVSLLGDSGLLILSRL